MPISISYIAVYRGRKTNIFASSQYEAFEMAMAYFKVPKSNQELLSVVPSEKDKQITKFRMVL